MSKQVEINDDAAANEEEVEEQIEQDNVEKEARENATGAEAPMIGGNKGMKSDNDALVSREEVEAQVEDNRVEKVAFEDGVSTASAEEYLRRGRTDG